ncbi:MAG: choice-of-anchor D domain-containing protein [Nitrospirae bacterium]|nr:choice-of-anchor D domain-containing protein [Nitrospirota bacterium]
MKKKLLTYGTFIAMLILALMVPFAGAYDTIGSCEGCHGGFRANTYSSLAAAKAANPAWPGTSLALHNGHANSSTGTPPGMLNGNCNACHFGSSRIPVYTYQSSGAAPFNQGCSGCHDGPGLRAHHVNSGADTCYDCHSDPAPDAENVLRPVYTAALGTTSGTTRVNDPCNPAAAGFEGRLKDVTTLGLDNDGNLLYDQSDPACAVAAPIISVSPTTLSFGNQAIGTTSAAQTVTISNTGTAVLSVTSITNSNTTDFILTAPATPLTINAGASQTFTVAFRPATAGAKSATISIASNGGSAAVNAAGTGVTPVLSVSPTTLTFGNQTIGTTSAAQTVTISNIGTATLNVTGLTSSNAEFAFSPSTIPPIAPGGNSLLSVTFTPAAPAGAKSATIGILSNGGNATVSATGTGAAAGALSVSPAALTYGNQTVGTTSPAQTVTISNTGGTALTVNSITNNNSVDFVLTAPVTPLTINGGASQTFTVAFRPATSGAKSATISITSTAGNASVSATGTGAAAGALSVSPAALTYGNQTVGTTSSKKTVTISNTGSTALTVNSITNSNSVDFVLTAPVTPLTINGGASQTFTVAFRPATSGAKSATISVTSTAGNASVSASGSGVTAGADDVALVKLSAPSTINTSVGRKYETKIIAQATTTVKETEATVTLTTVYPSGLQVRIEHPSRTKDLHANDSEPKKFEFESEIVCAKKGIWPITWTATIRSETNSNLLNDVLTRKTQVTCY